MAQLSDYNYEPRSSNIARDQLYSDLDLSFRIHPVIKDIMPLRDADAIKNSLKNLIFSYMYSRPFSPYIQSNIRNLLFEPNTIFTQLAIKDTLTQIIRDREPRIDNFEVDVEDQTDTNSYKITITFQISYDIAEQTVLFIERLR
jgi:phage baseplate assembly protein W